MLFYRVCIVMFERWLAFDKIRGTNDKEHSLTYYSEIAGGEDKFASTSL